MGPGCFHPRNEDGSARSGVPEAASMGPGCFHPRNETPTGQLGDAAPLQWGRDVSIPEMLRPRCVAALQSKASMGPGCFHPRNGGCVMWGVQQMRASMGPGCFHPRNASHEAGTRGFEWLQWGRDVSIPEMPPASTCARTSRSRFNGAGMFPSQKCTGLGFVVGAALASMGPGCFHPRNVPENLVSPLVGWLQWGRDVSIPEI